MRKIIMALVAVLGLTLAFPVAAAADHAQDWSGNGDSHVVNQSTVHLEGGTDLGTSVETAALGITVDKGDEISFHYELFDDAECAGGAPRVFVVVDGAAPPFNNSWDGNPGQCGTENTVTFQVDRSGLISLAGVVYDNVPEGEEQVVGAIEVTDLVVAGEDVHFMNPPPPEVCEFDDSLTVEDPKCVKPTPDPEPTKTATPTEEPTATPTATKEPPVGTGKLPETGAPGWLTGTIIGVALFGAGLALLLWRRSREF